VLIDVEHRNCPCCGGGMHMIGELRTEQLDIVPAQLRVRVTRRPRYACRTCEGAVMVAPAPERPIDGGMATEALVAHVLVSKFCDSLPLYRQSQMLARQGMALDRSTLSNWVGRACWWLTPLYDLLVSTALACPKVFADDTTLPVLDPGRGRTKTGRIWCYAVDDRPWAGLTHPVAAYVYAEDRKGSRPAGHLAAFRGVLQVDGYDGFKRLALDRADSSVTLAFCWARLPKVPCAKRMEWQTRGICGAPSTSSMSRRSRRLPPGCWRKSVNSTPLKLISAASPPNTDDGFARSEVVRLSRLCTPGYRITSAASRPSRIWPRPFAMPSDTGPA
jgi:transposase